MRIADPARFLAFDTATLVERLADEHAHALTSQVGRGPYRVVAASSAYAIAVEVARRLREMSVTVVGPVLVAGEHGGPEPLEAHDAVRQHVLAGLRRHEPYPFAGDLIVVEPPGAATDDRVAWDDVCLGVVHRPTIPGDGGWTAALTALLRSAVADAGAPP